MTRLMTKSVFLHQMSRDMTKQTKWLLVVCKQPVSGHFFYPVIFGFALSHGLYVSSFVTRSTLSLFALVVTWSYVSYVQDTVFLQLLNFVLNLLNFHPPILDHHISFPHRLSFIIYVFVTPSKDISYQLPGILLLLNYFSLKGKKGNNEWLRYCLFSKIVSHVKSLMRRIMP